MKTDIRPDIVIDTKGLQCPRPLLKAKQTLEGMNPGEVLEVVANDLTTKTTFAAYTKRSGDELITVVEDGPEIHLFVKKGSGSSK